VGHAEDHERQGLRMCLAIPALVVALPAPDVARIDLGGVRKDISLALVEDVHVGDYVIVHVGYALTKLDPDEAERTLALMAEAGLVDATNGTATAPSPAATDCTPSEGGPTIGIVGPASAGQPAAGRGAE
jgi:hydrogenase expression/formation protein HypC